MSVLFDPERLPAALRDEVVRALTTGEGYEVAIEEIEHHLANGGERSHDVLIALARLTYEDAASLVLSQLGRASLRAVALLDEAIEARDGQAGVGELISMRRVYAATLERERDRERRLRLNLVDPSRARPVELIELAHRILMAGDDDGVAATLMREATREHQAREDEALAAEAASGDDSHRTGA